MNRFILTAIAFLGLTSAAFAIPRGGMATGAIPPTPPFPTTQTVSFGQKTRVGYGGSDMQYTNQSVLGASRWLKVTSQVNNVSGAVTLFSVDDRNMLVPCTTATTPCTATYGNSWTATATPYTVVVTEYSDSGRTTPTGNISTITVNTVANKATVREMTSSSKGCSINCEVTNPDNDAGSNAFQYAQMVNNAYVGYGDQVEWRTGFFNPTSLRYIIKIETLAGSGCVGYLSGTLANCLNVTSETVDNSVDSNGNPTLANGGKFGGWTFDYNDVGDVAIPIVYDHLYCSIAVASSPNGFCIGGNNTTGYGWSITNSRLEEQCGTTNANEDFIISNGGPNDYVLNNHAVSCSAANGGITGGRFVTMGSSGSAHNSGTIKGNIQEYPWSDFIDVYGGPFVVQDNFVFGFQNDGGNHPDCLQSFGTNAASSQALSNWSRNICVRGPGQFNTEDSQGIPFIKADGGPVPFTGSGTGVYTGAVLENNISMLTATNGFWFQNLSSPTVRFNTTISVVQSTFTGASGAVLSSNANPNVTSTGGTFVQNFSNAIDLSSQGGSPTISDNAQITYNASLPSIYTGAGFSSYVTGSPACPQYCSRASVIATMHPDAITAGSKTARNPDGTYIGFLTPPDVGGHPCWNTTITNFDPTQTCAAQGLTQAS